ncbi:MAG: response regulator [Rhizobiaceae bacterium]|nr:response regulator [Rhizobiaceae bacterium]
MNAQPRRTLRLLAVDDDASSAELIVRVAERCGYEAFATSDSRGVVNLATALNLDIMAVDINMPNVDAVGLFKLLAEAAYKGRILIVSGEDLAVLTETQRKAEALGLSVPYVQQKPLDFQKLRAMLMARDVLSAA